jgi:hypothetical protein
MGIRDRLEYLSMQWQSKCLLMRRITLRNELAKPGKKIIFEVPGEVNE